MSSVYESGSQKPRGSTMDVRGSQRALLGTGDSGQLSAVGFEKRIVKGGMSVNRNNMGGLGSSNKNCKSIACC